ncbi:division plane positioning ATPase MipZ [Pseudomonas sp. NPDC088368]|uniref:division plane positioning ATPase MipZ n=1 Tax=Pseudomonas sp. NPDC088368 TaxID=3364453 RepID=UPI00381479B9
MILSISGEKGGSGKTTLACNLAIWATKRGHDVLVVDSDTQTSASRFFDRREQRGLSKVPCIQKTGDLYSTLRDLNNRFEVVIVDVGGRDSRELRTAMLAADVMVAPYQASQLDLETLPYFEEVIEGALAINPNMKSMGVITRSPNYPSQRELMDARRAITQLKWIAPLNQVIKDRKIYRDAFIEGKGVIEMANHKARAEIELLGQEILQRIAQ